MKALILAGGKEPSFDILKEEAKNSDYIICADRGANCLYKYNIVPDYLLGDFDSINKDILDFFKSKECKMEVYPPEKDYTDTHIALKRAMDLNVSEIVFLGATGTRFDHVLGNLGLLNICLENDIKAYIRDDNNKIILLDKSIDFKVQRNKYFSVQAYENKVEGFSLKNAKYPLDNYTLKVGDTLTISNEFVEKDLEISFKKGKVIFIISND